MDDRSQAGSRGSATVEQIGLLLLVGALIATLIAAYSNAPGARPGHGLGIRIANRIVCGPREPGSCRQHPTVAAYGWDIARAVRWLAPVPGAERGPDGDALVPVDFRYCRHAGCAVPGVAAGLTTANRRTTLFTRVQRDPSGAGWLVTYWSYRPSLGWERTVRRAGPAEIEAASGTRLRLEDDPRLVPLEILPGRNHYEFPRGEEPPWRWRVETTRNGWSA